MAGPSSERGQVALLASVSCWLAGWGAAAVIIGREVLAWRRTGVWPGWSLADGLLKLNMTPPTSAWLPLERLYEIVLSIPLALALAGAGMLIGWVVSALGRTS